LECTNQIPHNNFKTKEEDAFDDTAEDDADDTAEDDADVDEKGVLSFPKRHASDHKETKSEDDETKERQRRRRRQRPPREEEKKRVAAAVAVEEVDESGSAERCEGGERRDPGVAGGWSDGAKRPRVVVG
jgi:hypothetical protein